MPRKMWSAEDDQFLVQFYRERGATWCAGLANCSKLSVYQRAHHLGLCRKHNHASDDQIERAIRSMHPRGLTDAEIARAIATENNSGVDRHRVGVIRKRMGLDSNTLSDHTRQRVAVKTREQLAKAGLNSLSDVRTERFNQWKRGLGWPDSLTVRAVQALEMFFQHGPLTRVQLCDLLGVSSRKRTAPTSNAKGGTVLAELAAAGLISRVRKGLQVPHNAILHQEAKPSRPRTSSRIIKTKWIDLYFLNPGVEPNNGRKATKHATAGGR